MRNTERLLERGWAGDLSEDELTFIVQALRLNGRLRLRWGFRKGKGKVSRERVKRRAQY